MMVLSSTALAESAFTSGYALVHDGSKIYYEVHGSGKKFLLLGFQVQPNQPTLRAFVEGFGDNYKLVVAEYPPGQGNPNAGEAKPYTLTPAAVARDYLAIATAAGADKFAFYGYSWGAASGFQLAIRTDRVKALVAGGFPMMNGPYRQMIKVLRAIVLENETTSTPEERQILTFYEALHSFDDRSAQSKLKMPRLNFVGTQDRVRFPGNVDVEFFRIFNESSQELREAGWDVLAVPDRNHETARAPEFSIPLIRKWLDENWTE